MHELSITQEIVKIAETSCVDHGGKKVVSIHLIIGEDTGFIGETIQMYFNAISKGTRCENASIILTGVKPMLKCQACGSLFERVFQSFSCPYCGGCGMPTPIGKECIVKSIEIET